MRRRAPIAVGVALLAMLGLSACTGTTAPVVPTSTPPPAPSIQEPSTEVLSATEVDSRGFERNTENENGFLAAASLGEVEAIAPDAGALSFPDYAKESGAAVPTTEYALNLVYWACDQAVTNPPEDDSIETLIDDVYGGMLTVTGYADSSPAAQAYGDLMFRGTSYLCEPEFTKYVEVPEGGTQ